MKLNQIWHCPRADLATNYLRLFDVGLVTTTSIFAPRRTGKTVFLLEDLTPAALKKGYGVAYADLWQTRLNPGIALIRGLERALEPKTVAQKALRKLREPVKKVKASGGLAGVKGELEVEFGDGKKEATEMALRIDELVGQLVARKPLLLLIDEAQELARTKENELMATALRTAITRHRDKIRVVFTGSSRSQLSHVFTNTDAPLYSVGATIHDFPLLGRELVEFVAAKFQKASQRSLDVAKLWKAFQGFKQQPEPFLQSIVAMLMDPGLTLEKACAVQRAVLDKEENHEGTWASMDALQRLLARAIADDPLTKPFSKAFLAKLCKGLGLPVVEAFTVQNAMRSLANRNVVSKSPRGFYVFESDAFERWVRTLDPG